jgi:predicted phage terminase large subunit-like protein
MPFVRLVSKPPRAERHQSQFERRQSRFERLEEPEYEEPEEELFDALPDYDPTVYDPPVGRPVLRHSLQEDPYFDPYSPRIIQPQPGPQTVFASSIADIAIFGGSAGGGKTLALLLEGGRHVNVPGYGGVIFRQSFPQITNQGGLWDTSRKIYPYIGGKPTRTELKWEWPLGTRVRFHHMQDDSVVNDWQGSQVPYIGWDEGTHFSSFQFWTVTLSRARSECGVKPYTRMSCNPDPLSWVKKFVAPWIDGGFPNPAESGELRWFMRDDEGEVVWVERDWRSKRGRKPISVTFVRSSVFDNKIMLAENPEYLDFLEALPLIERERLLYGNWDIMESGNMFRRAWFQQRIAWAFVPRDCRWCRFWDLAASEVKKGKKEPDFTASALLGYSESTGRYYFKDLLLMQETPWVVKNAALETAISDLRMLRAHGCHSYKIRLEEEPGASGITVTDDYRRFFEEKLAFTDFDGIRSTGSKVERAKTISADAQRGLVIMVEEEGETAAWIDTWLSYAAPFPRLGVKDDPVDACSGARIALSEETDDPCPVNMEDRYKILTVRGRDYVAGGMILPRGAWPG